MFGRLLGRLTRRRQNRHELRRKAEAKALELRAKALEAERKQLERTRITKLKQLKCGMQYWLAVPGIGTTAVTVMHHEQGQPICFAPKWNRGDNTVIRILGWRQMSSKNAGIIKSLPKGKDHADYSLVISYEYTRTSTLAPLRAGSSFFRVTSRQRLALT